MRFSKGIIPGQGGKQNTLKQKGKYFNLSVNTAWV